MDSLCIAGLCVAANNIKPLSVTMETQEWVPFAMLLSYKIFCTAANNVNILRSSRKVPDTVV
jgi:hypothetical protein